ncbi:putative tetratricopeptide repeat domain containing protein [Monocercomonoides exilis]|uniref:putative tetratricopeptide repeat domain containing protein n=1 Tax=Monocercomonoides exilis TaxID=2049356 RepID=UPI00355A71E2|nr:putative tetratricopeptide repeat domain containing protein [Monocercomonoides exilis]|eukprot:MONOS_843.1-p1 / transcript=MONOS_843.1 / gene=MONOS_843 / organism=Monocercomonoides_exilis_PA203 / gene_product=tetratricopeptide repeat domain containing protein / transcript_product=tetratricopeptide repeat domain containing protein / location=Mono_scaffold00014:52952-55687(+) / protein_length=757 / sequence_SO=supercontig / SO=protein_coding / is_pseudo=false
MSSDKKKVDQLFLRIGEKVQAEEYEEAEELSDKILSIKPNDIDARKCKVLCLLHLDNFDEALEFIGEDENLLFEKAYSLYRQQRYAEAYPIIKSIENPPLCVRHLDAQISFRLEKFKRAARIYGDLFKENPKDEELKTNYLAALSMSRPEEIRKIVLSGEKSGDSPSFESLYNQACCFIAMGNYSAAIAVLDESERICREENEEEDEEYIANETAVILAQKGYALAKTGNFEEAQHIFDTLVQLRPSDPAVLVVACANSAALLGRNCKDIDIKKVRAASSEGVMKTKLNGIQRSIIHFTKFALSLNTKKFDQVRDYVNQIESLGIHDERGVVMQMLYAGVVQKQLSRMEQIGRDFLDAFSATPSPVETSRVALLMADLLFRLRRNDEAEQVLMTHFHPVLRMMPPVSGLLNAIQSKGKKGGDKGAKKNTTEDFEKTASLLRQLRDDRKIRDSQEKEMIKALNLPVPTLPDTVSSDVPASSRWFPSMSTLLSLPFIHCQSGVVPLSTAASSSIVPSSSSSSESQQQSFGQINAPIFHLPVQTVETIFCSMAMSAARHSEQKQNYESAITFWKMLSSSETYQRFGRIGRITSECALNPTVTEKKMLDVPSVDILDTEDVNSLEGFAELLKGCSSEKAKMSSKGSQASKKSKAKDTSVAEETEKRKKKRKRKIRYPKSYNPMAEPDPNRWISRKYVDSKSKKGKGKTTNIYAKGVSQGSTNVDEIHHITRSAEEIEMDEKKEKIMAVAKQTQKRGGRRKK